MKLKIENTTKYRQKIENATKYIQKKPLKFLLCVVVSLWVYVGVCVYVYEWMSVFKLSQARNVKRLL